jgi:dTDP-4-dehydrorhamnose 3,5-epimerase-like enzyme
MSYFINLPTYSDKRGSLTIIDDAKSKLPFEVERIFCIYNTSDLPRGGHKHHQAKEACIAIKGSCTISTNRDGQPIEDFVLDSATKCLIIDNDEWRTLHSFSNDVVIIVLASYIYDPADYIYPENSTH